MEEAIFAISITLAPGHAQAVLHYKTHDSMRGAMETLRLAQSTAGAMRAILFDDYSRTLEVALKDILAVCYSEIETANESAEAAGLLQQQANARLNKKWMADPLFRSLQSMAQLATVGSGGRQQ